MANPRIDMTGKRFGRLTVLSFDGPYGATTAAGWRCRCDCGEIVVRSGGGLRLGQSLSCGCLRKEKLVSRNKAGRTYGTKSGQYRHWLGMIRRCHEEGSSNYKNYGAKGTTVCDRWRYSYENFVKDMGKRPEGMSLDRIDNNLGYSPENCRWATHKEQGANKRNVPILFIDGKAMTYPDACKHYGILYVTFKNRTNTLGWSVDAALKTPPITPESRRSRRGAPKP
jgi:hypothetical protein